MSKKIKKKINENLPAFLIAIGLVLILFLLPAFLIDESCKDQECGLNLTALEQNSDSKSIELPSGRTITFSNYTRFEQYCELNPTYWMCICGDNKFCLEINLQKELENGRN